MAENLNIEYKVNGKVYNSFADKDNGNIYGRFYTWGAAMDSAAVYSEDGKGCGYGVYCNPEYPVRGLCPSGWHLPDSTEWVTMFNTVGKSRYALQAKGYYEWPYAKDEYGFSALPAGYYYEGSFYNVGSRACFKSSTATRRFNDFWGLGMNVDKSFAEFASHMKGYAESIRCIKD